jgi:flagellar assembly factor FliW
LDDYALSFIIMPLEMTNELISKEDLLEAAADLGLNESTMQIYLIVNIYREGSNVRMSVNARAPVFVETTHNHATQVVLRNNAYLVRQPLGGSGEIGTSPLS